MAQPKYGGRDCELSTTGTDARGESIDPWKVTRGVLEQMAPALGEAGVRVWSRQMESSSYGYGYASAFSFDCLRHWSSGGQCYYADLGHLECCTASCLRPTTFARQCLSTLLAAEAARKRAELESDGHSYALTASNADLLDPSISFGTHISFAVEPSLWEDLFVEPRHPAILGYVSSAVAAAIAFFGAGYLLPLKDGTSIYSLSARAHHISKIKTLSTTEAYSRGLLNTRREPHGKGHDRLHLIGFDQCLCSPALLFSLLQCTLAAAEEGYCGLNLFDPVRALRNWSWSLDPGTGQLPATAVLIDGRQLTLPAYIKELATTLLGMTEAGLITPQVAPQAKDMLPRVIELAEYAAEGSVTRCAKHLTWAAKLLWLTQLCADGAQLGDAQTRLADHDFSHTDPSQGALWRLWEAGMVDPLVDLPSAAAALREGPAESRDWGRGQIIRRYRDDIADVDWSYVDLRSPSAGRWQPRLRIDMPHLDSLNKHQFSQTIQEAENARHLADLLAESHTACARETDPLDDMSRQIAVVPQRRAGGDGA